MQCKRSHPDCSKHTRNTKVLTSLRLQKFYVRYRMSLVTDQYIVYVLYKCSILVTVIVLCNKNNVICNKNNMYCPSLPDVINLTLLNGRIGNNFYRTTFLLLLFFTRNRQDASVNKWSQVNAGSIRCLASACYDTYINSVNSARL